MSQARNAQVQATSRKLKAQFDGLEWAGEIITWSMGGQAGQPQTAVTEALQAAGLDASVCRTMLPRHIFKRAIKKLSDQRVIDVVRDGSRELIFQFTKKELAIITAAKNGEDAEVQFGKEDYLRLDKYNGTIEGTVPALVERAKELYEDAKDKYTSADITRMVQRLADDNADLFPIREQGGVYFVPITKQAFLDKLETFLSKLGGYLTRIPVPAGTAKGDTSITNAVQSQFQGLVRDHKTAIAELTPNATKASLDSAAAKIKATKVKMEAYTHYLNQTKAQMVKELAACDKELQAKVKELQNRPEGEKQKRVELYDHAVTAVLRWMGKHSWTAAEATKALQGKKITIAKATISAQLLAGAKGERGEPANLKPAQAKELSKLAGK